MTDNTGEGARWEDQRDTVHGQTDAGELARRLGWSLLPSAVERAVRLAEAITADPNTTHHGDGAWTVQDVVNVALARGLDVLERQYLAGDP